MHYYRCCVAMLLPILMGSCLPGMAVDDGDAEKQPALFHRIDRKVLRRFGGIVVAPEPSQRLRQIEGSLRATFKDASSIILVDA